jgi:hypothetical protein
MRQIIIIAVSGLFLPFCNLPSQLHNCPFLCVPLRNRYYCVRFDVFIVVTMKNVVHWDVMPCGSSRNRHFGRTFHPLPPKCRFLLEPHGVTAQKVAFFKYYFIFCMKIRTEALFYFACDCFVIENIFSELDPLV